AAVTENDFFEVDAAAVMTVRRRGGNAPERLGHEQVLERPVVVPLPELGSQVVTPEVGVDVANEELAQVLRDGRGHARPRKEGAGRGEQAVEDALRGVERRFDVGNAAVLVDPEVLDVARVAAHEIHEALTGRNVGGDLTASRLEVVQEVELLVVDEGQR